MSRKHTSKRENKRLDSKKVRAAEKAALNGGHVKSVHTGGWAGKDDRQPPLPDISSQGKKRAKKKAIEYCPSREGKQRHAYLQDEYWEIYDDYWWTDEKPTKEKLIRFKLCVYCGKQVSVKVNWHYRHREIK